jgi:hypothetical protein
LRCFYNTPKYIRKALKGSSTHGLLAAAICLDNSPSLEIWKATWPTFHDFDLTLPIRWPLELRDLLPHSAKCVLEKQERKFKRDWDLVREAFVHGFTRDQYMYAWLIVNTRSFYHTERGRENVSRSDRMCLQPVADLFNHRARGCDVHYDSAGFTIAVEKDTPAGEELYVRYGGHTNDTLLAEYGFIVPNHENPCDDTVIDVHLCTKFTITQSEALQAAGYWGDFVIDSDGPCYRTQVAARCLNLPPAVWPDVFSGERPEDIDAASTSRNIFVALREYEKDIIRIVRFIDRSYDGEDKSREILRRRWLEIKEFVTANMDRLECGARGLPRRKPTPSSPGSSRASPGSSRPRKPLPSASPSSSRATPSSSRASPTSGATPASTSGLTGSASPV